MNPQKNDVYPSFLDQKPSLFLGRVLYRLFKRVQFDENMTEPLREMHRKGTVIYATKYRGHLDYLLYHYRFRRGRLPYPKIAFDVNISLFLPLSQVAKILRFHLSYFLRHRQLPSPFKTEYFKRAVENGTPCLLYLVDPKGFRRSFMGAEQSALHFLLQTQREMDRPIYLVPQLVLYKKTPEKERATMLDIFFGFRDNPGIIRKIVLFFRYNRRAFIDFGRPIDLKTYLEGQPETRSLEDMTAEVRHQLIESIDGQKRVILGPIMKSRQQFKEKVLTGPKISGFIKDGAGQNKIKAQQFRRKASEYFDEIAADYNGAYVQFLHRLLTWFWKRVFEEIDVEKRGLALAREWARKGPLIYVPSHKSHVDYLVLNYVLHEHHMHIPRIAAGKNLAFWPMGHIFRKCGAFFIRRTLGGARLYTKVLTSYIKALIEEGHPLQFFIEGGRSRSGKLILPKTGFLSILFQAYEEGYAHDLTFVPASITYDRVLEEKAYLKEVGGGTKEKENIKQVLQARRFLKRKYGKVYIRFGEPLSLRQYLSRTETPQDAGPEELAFELVGAINKIVLVTPLSLIASAILTRHRRGFHLAELGSTVQTLLDFLHTFQVPTATTLADPVQGIEETIALLTDWKVMNAVEDVDEEKPFYYVEEDKKQELEYYKNSIIHYFIFHAFIAVSFLTNTREAKTQEALLADYAFMKKLFKHEFIFPQWKNTPKAMEEEVRYFLDAAFITQDRPGEYQVTQLGLEKLPVWAGLAKTFLESYWIALRAFMRQEKKKKKKADLLKDMRDRGLLFHKLGLIDHAEAVSQISFKNALTFIKEEVLQGQDKADTREKLSRMGKRIYHLSRFRG